MNRYSFKRSSSAFTLVELLVVVTLIAIVSSILIALVSGASKHASERVNESNIKHLTGHISAYSQLHGGALPDKLDSLLDGNKIENVPYETYQVTSGGSFETEVKTLAPGDGGKAIYCGKDEDKDGVNDDPSGTSKGIHPSAWSGLFATLTVTELSENDIDELRDLGITTVYDIVSEGALFHGNESFAERRLEVGDPVVAVDPKTVRNGMGVYRAFGMHNLDDVDRYPRDSDGPPGPQGLSDGGRATAMNDLRLLVFGIGDNSTLVGNRKLGVHEAPKSMVVPTGYYNKYLLVVKIGGRSASDMGSDFAGILDPNGNTSRSAASWATRTGK